VGGKRENTMQGHKFCRVFTFLRVSAARNTQKWHRKLNHKNLVRREPNRSSSCGRRDEETKTTLHLDNF